MSRSTTPAVLRRMVTVGAVVAGMALAGCSQEGERESTGPSSEHRADAGTTAGRSGREVVERAPATPPARVCGSSSLLGPATPPTGAIVVDPGQDLPAVVDAAPPGSTFWLQAGTHHYGQGLYEQVTPRTGDRFVGAPGAVIDGRHHNLYAFGGHATGVSLSHLTVQNFGTRLDNRDQGVVNHDAAHDWTFADLTVRGNGGAGIFLGSGNTLRGSCLADNGQYGFSAYEDDGVRDLVVLGNEIVGNNTADWENRRPGCGCTGGGKFWNVTGGVVAQNWVHGNHGTGLWADTNNAGFLFEGNYFDRNAGPALIYETSYNARISFNTFDRNGLVDGPDNAGFPTGAVYVSESGSDSRVRTDYHDEFQITDNHFVDNWGGVVAWENADRFAGSPANTSTGHSTLVAPETATLQACSTPSRIRTKPYFDDCRWKVQHLRVHDNRFVFRPQLLGSRCTVDRMCGFSGLFSNFGTYPEWSPYHGTVVERQITFQQDNHWTDNTYVGPWRFLALEQGNRVSWRQWRAAPYRQDAGSVVRK